MTELPPKVSIGLPVFNGEKYIREAIESILAQTFTDFELIISDNSSTDKTEEICSEYVAKDSRICYFRNQTNIGAANNENRTFELSRGQYFRLASHDDKFASTLIEKSVEILDNNPSVVLCYSEIVKIDENGIPLTIVHSEFAASEKPHERFRDLAKQHSCEPSYSLIRSDILRKTELQPDYPESDFGFLCELSLHGKFYLIHEPLFFRRCHPLAISSVSNPYEKAASYTLGLDFHIKENPSFIKLLYFYLHYFSIQFSHFSRIIVSAPISLAEKIWCFFYVLRFLSSKILFETTRDFRKKVFLTRETWSVFYKRCVQFFSEVSSEPRN
jgi:glycosyltransferase involved in cell wall biosynthesis